MRIFVMCNLSAFASTPWRAARCTCPDLSLSLLFYLLEDDEEEEDFEDDWSWRYFSGLGFRA